MKCDDLMIATYTLDVAYLVLYICRVSIKMVYLTQFLSYGPSFKKGIRLRPYKSSYSHRIFHVPTDNREMLVINMSLCRYIIFSLIFKIVIILLPWIESGHCQDLSELT